MGSDVAVREARQDPFNFALHSPARCLSLPPEELGAVELEQREEGPTHDRQNLAAGGPLNKRRNSLS
jgi:hypothetical protein